MIAARIFAVSTVVMFAVCGVRCGAAGDKSDQAQWSCESPAIYQSELDAESHYRTGGRLC